MKLSTLLLGTSAAFIGSLATGSFAQTTVPSGCSWVTTSVQSGPTGAIVNSACQLNGVSLATREQKHNQYSPSCTITWIATGYTQKGPCESAEIVKYVTSSTAATTTQTCYTGSSIIVQTGPNGYMNPAINPSTFCGQGCPYSVQPLDPYSYPRLKYTCL
jgi:hypothetical protein